LAGPTAQGIVAPARGRRKWPHDAIRQRSGRAARRAARHAGFGEVYIGRVGGEHDGFSDFYANTVLPRLREG